METIFVPITCIVCKRHSALPLSSAEIRQRLDSGAPIELRCAYDDVTWDAASRERLQLMRLLIENDAVDQGMMGRRRSQPQRMSAT